MFFDCLCFGFNLVFFWYCKVVHREKCYVVPVYWAPDLIRITVRGVTPESVAIIWTMTLSAGQLTCNLTCSSSGCKQSLCFHIHAPIVQPFLKTIHRWSFHNMSRRFVPHIHNSPTEKKHLLSCNLLLYTFNFHLCPLKCQNLSQFWKPSVSRHELYCSAVM